MTSKYQINGQNLQHSDENVPTLFDESHESSTNKPSTGDIVEGTS
jgi:hypothetical protein